MAINKPEHITVNGSEREVKYVIMDPVTGQFYNKKHDDFSNNLNSATTNRFAEWAINDLDNKTDAEIDGLVAVATIRNDNNQVAAIGRARQYDAASQSLQPVDAHDLFEGDLIEYDTTPKEMMSELRYVEHVEQLSLNLDGLDDENGLQK